MNNKQLDNCSKHLDKAISSILDAIFIINEEIYKIETNKMDKKMHQVTKRMETAERDIKKGKPKTATKVLKNAEKKNEKLVKIDRDIRDPMIEKCKKEMHKKKK